MSKTIIPMVRIHNSQTNEVIDREMNADEFALYELDKANSAAQAEAQAQAATAKSALLERLGITAEEAALLLG
jgi:hypothetical protein